ncbi:hypothetical protein F352_073 [Campylobacter phage F352]|uniref:Uncharacterized protein n=4 Tax=Fletchervirus CPX TaxID=1110702 RepID=A0A7T3KHS3_9CAUD|nr:hypothetical protein F348_074 [Campylobacter phage F348]QPX63377.1 hypothetical protein F352_073 [Campylobacter phage F352]QPX65513.1 hypothetical protein F374_072 [Campylobacter phage F374]QPX65680.1 hypothetical protein F375_073 [Campylobacter phage F375]
MLEHIKNFCAGAPIVGGIILLCILVIYFPYIMLPLIMAILLISFSYHIGQELRDKEEIKEEMKEFD